MSQFYLPTKVVFGKDCLKEFGGLITGFGKKALIVTGKSSAEKSGALSDLKEQLKKYNLSWHHYSDVEENPTLSIIKKGAEAFKEQECDFFVGIGGGSPIDAAKAMSALAANDMTIREIYNPNNIKKAYHIVAIPTTSGTGSEVTQYSVITDTENKKKAGFGSPLLFPKLSFLDPKYTLTLPLRGTRDTAIDALSHLLEGVYSKDRSPMLTPYIYRGVKLILDNLPKVQKEHLNYEIRENLQLASLYGGIVIAQTGTTLQHSIGYPLTTHHNLSHGEANGVVMKDIMELYTPAISKYLDDLFEGVGITKTEFFSWLEQWDFAPGLNLKEEFIIKSSEETMKSRNIALTPVSVTANDIQEILRKISR